MKKIAINFLSVFLISFGTIYLSSPGSAYSQGETCTGGCTGCLGEECSGGDTYCGAIEPVDDPGNITYCYKGGPGEIE
ncbi:MAG: hypothetical protein U5J95_02675 [Balneolaceae bacterium]|nr:hypothetical protein [Balneolaceae bacterium]